MKITKDLLLWHEACGWQVARFSELYPDGAEPTVDVVFDIAAEGLDAWWLWRLLPAEGPGSRREYTLWCAEQVEELMPESVRRDVLPVIRQRVSDPASVSDGAMFAAWSAAWSAANVAESAAARAAAWAGAWAAASSEAGDAAVNAAVDEAAAAADAACPSAGPASRGGQLEKLSDLLLAAK